MYLLTTGELNLANLEQIIMKILHIDASARPGRSGNQAHGSHTRRLTHRLVTQWQASRPQDEIIYRDIGASPPGIINGDWIHAAFAPADKQQPWMNKTLAESDTLVNELIAADLLVLGLPLYNFNVPAAFKAWIDQVVRINKTVAFNPDDHLNPFVPLLADRPRHAIVLSSRGGYGLGPGGEFAHMNHLEPSVATALGFMGINEMHSIAIEHQEEGGEVLAESIRQAEAKVDQLAKKLLVLANTSSPPRGQ